MVQSSYIDDGRNKVYGKEKCGKVGVNIDVK